MANFGAKYNMTDMLWDAIKSVINPRAVKCTQSIKRIIQCTFKEVKQAIILTLEEKKNGVK